jgi:8-oxo-dGTP diphosphatase
MITISEPKPEDAEGINEVIKQSWYSTYTKAEIGVTKEAIDQMYAESEKKQIEVFRKRASNPQKDDISIVAKDEGRVVGVIRVVTFPDHSRVRTFYVDPKRTGEGIGTSLWKEVLLALPKDRPVIAWPTMHTKSVDFYKKLGFVATGETEFTDPKQESGINMQILKMAYTPTKRERAVGIVIKDTEVLLIYRKVNGKEYFTFPGGGVDEGETTEQAAAREVREETSIECQVDKLLYRLIDQNSIHNFYLCAYIAGEPMLTNDSHEGQRTNENNYHKPDWHKIAELESTLVFPLEIRDLFIQDFKNGFKNEPIEFEKNSADRRKSL